MKKSKTDSEKTITSELDDYKVKIEISVTPLGKLGIEWKIPIVYLNTNETIYIELPGFKYDLPKVGGLPVPFSSRAIPLKISNLELSNKTDFNYELKDHKLGNKLISIKPIKDNLTSSVGYVYLTYEIENIVNNDTIFFVFVYPFINPFKQSVKYEFKIQTKFSFNIRRYKFREWYFVKSTGTRLKSKKKFKDYKINDLIILESKDLELEYYEELDIHLTGTRFPFMIRRDVFWIIVFIISLSIILSPIWTMLFVEN